MRRTIKIVLTLIIFNLLSSCDDSPIVVQEKRNGIKIIIPTNEISGITEIKIEISEHLSADSVLIIFDRDMFVLYESPFEILLNTFNYENGPYILQAILFSSGRIEDKDELNISIVNSDTVSKSVIFKSVTYLNNNTLLKWSKSSNINFGKYKLYQSSNNNQLHELAVITNVLDTSFTINSTPINTRSLYVINDVGLDSIISKPDSIIGSTYPLIAYILNKGGSYIEIHTMDIDGYNQTRITFDERIDRKIQFLPDGQSFLFESSNHERTIIKHMQIDGLLLNELPYGASFYDLAPDKKNIVYWNSNGLFVTDFYGSFNNKLTEKGGIPNYSSDGNWITFSRWFSEDIRIHIIIKIKIDGSEEIQLTDTSNNCSNSLYSNNGLKIAYTQRYDDYSKLAIMNSDGSEQQEFEIILDKYLFYPLVFSPDDSRLLYYKGLVELPGVYEYNIIANEEIKLSDGRFPSYSASGNKILFTSSETGNDEIYIMNVDGTNKKRLTNSWGWEEVAVFQESSL